MRINEELFGLLCWITVIVLAMTPGLVWGQEPEPEPTTYTTADMLLKWGEGVEAATPPPGLEDFYDKDYYGPAQIYCANGYDFDIWIVTKDGSVAVPAKGYFVLTRKN